jgi:hypothetical protein
MLLASCSVVMANKPAETSSQPSPKLQLARACYVPYYLTFEYPNFRNFGLGGKPVRLNLADPHLLRVFVPCLLHIRLERTFVPA